MTIYTNADFISCDENDTTYNIMVVDNKGKIAYIGYNIPLCYDNEKTVDLAGTAVVPAAAPILKDQIVPESSCTVFCEGANADFVVLKKNILKYPQEAEILSTYIRGKDICRKSNLFSFLKRMI